MTCGSMTASAPAARTGRTCRSASASRRCASTGSPSVAPADAGDAMRRPMWLPNALYEALPLVYIGAGVLQLVCAFFIEAGPRALLLVLGALCVAAGLGGWVWRAGVTRTPGGNTTTG